MSGDPMKHHVDCDYRNSMMAREAEETFGLPERTAVYYCNLVCVEDPRCERCGNGTFGASVCGVCKREQKAATA